MPALPLAPPPLTPSPPRPRSDRHVVIIAQRTILGAGYKRDRNTSGPIPRSRTLTAVHTAMLDVRGARALRAAAAAAR